MDENSRFVIEPEEVETNDDKGDSQKDNENETGSRESQSSSHNSESFRSSYDSQGEDNNNSSTSRFSKQRSNRVAFIESATVSLKLNNPSAEDELRTNSLFDEATLIPDISIMCRMCKLHINIEELREHKIFHDTLSFLGFKQLPADEAELIQKRKQHQSSLYAKFMRRSRDLNGNKTFIWNMKIKQLNFAFELIRAYLNNSYEINRKFENKNLYTDVYADCRLPVDNYILAIGSSLNQNKPFRKSMDDANVIIESFGERDNLTYIGTFNGYDGDVASRKCSSQMHLALLSYLERIEESQVKFIKDKYVFDEINKLTKYEKFNFTEDLDDYFEKTNGKRKQGPETEEIDKATKSYLRTYKYAFFYAYKQMDRLLARGKDEFSKVRWSGTTTCTCIIDSKPFIESQSHKDEKWLHVANCGDVEAIIIVDNRMSKYKIKRNYKVLTRLHTVSGYVKDRDRLDRNGCNLIQTSHGEKQVEGLFNITRALGFYGDESVKKFITPVPSIRSMKLEPNFICLIIATRGLWDVLNYSRVAEIVLQTLPPGRISFANERLMASASVKAMAHQYYHGRDRERLKEKSKLETVEDISERIRDEDEGSNAEYYQKMVDSEENDVGVDNQIIEENFEKGATPDRETASSSISLSSDLGASKSTSVKITKDRSKPSSASSEVNRFYTSKDLRPFTVPFGVHLNKGFEAGTPSDEEDESYAGPKKSSYSLFSEKVAGQDEDNPSSANLDLNKNEDEKEDGEDADSDKEKEKNEEKDEQEEHDDDKDIEIGSQTYYSTNYDQTQDSASFQKTSKIEQPTSKKTTYYKAHSDIYPVSKRHALTNRQRDLAIDIEQLDTGSVEIEYRKKNKTKKEEPSYEAGSNASNDIEDDFSSVNLDDFDNEILKKKFDKRVELVPTSNKIVQTNYYDIDREARKNLGSKMAKRVDITDLITEQLMKCALLAGSTENIVVNCVLLPGSNF